jgi:hypothetical protein
LSNLSSRNHYLSRGFHFDQKDLHQLESNPFLKNIMDQRMEVDANSMDSYPNDVPDVRALYPCRVRNYFDIR